MCYYDAIASSRPTQTTCGGTGVGAALRVETVPSDVEGRVFEPLGELRNVLNNPPCARPEVAVGVFEESGAGMRIDGSVTEDSAAGEPAILMSGTVGPPGTFIPKDAGSKSTAWFNFIVNEYEPRMSVHDGGAATDSVSRCITCLARSQLRRHVEGSGMDWEDETWTKREGRWESRHTGAEPNHEIVKGRYLKIVISADQSSQAVIYIVGSLPGLITGRRAADGQGQRLPKRETGMTKDIDRSSSPFLSLTYIILDGVKKVQLKWESDVDTVSGLACDANARDRGTGRHVYAQRRRIQVYRWVTYALPEVASPNFTLLDRFNFMVVEYEPRMRSLHNGNVVPMMGVGGSLQPMQSADASQDDTYHMDAIPPDNSK
ncbi:hypothetical protein F5888DRAFT_1893013 [Russula emetica]|nr:hypothetical protein F5888DRAFT_1893013 [Russula emetica]